jgi:hypothetical protein
MLCLECRALWVHYGFLLAVYSMHVYQQHTTNSVHRFDVVAGLQPGARKRLEGWRLKLQEEADQTSASPAQGPVGATGADQNM